MYVDKNIKDNLNRKNVSNPDSERMKHKSMDFGTGALANQIHVPDSEDMLFHQNDRDVYDQYPPSDEDSNYSSALSIQDSSDPEDDEETLKNKTWCGITIKK